jgi:hypothetical protein
MKGLRIASYIEDMKNTHKGFGRKIGLKRLIEMFMSI